MSRTSAVFFDVDFTLIHPGPRFQASGYLETCARHGVVVDPTRFDAAVAGAIVVLDEAAQEFDPQVFIDYTARIIELMGGDRDRSLAPAKEIYDAWALHDHFSLYDDVDFTLRVLKERGLHLGLISNGHRSLTSFQSHFELDGLISVTISSLDHGYMKPHASIFLAALAAVRVPPEEAVMVGDSYAHDVVGAEQVGMRGILLARDGRGAPEGATSPAIRSLIELLPLL
ncbi:MAG: HAD family hydrolase [Acidobacteriota bacterium]